MHNPIRRSRKIGKTQGGRVNFDGKATEKWSRSSQHQDLYTRLSENGDRWQILRENPSRDYYHPCSGEDYVGVLRRLPPVYADRVAAILLSKLSKKDERRGIDARRRYRCVLMNAFPKSNEMAWSYRPLEVDRRHMAPWCDRWRTDGGRWRLVWTPDEVRRYYLYHVFLHEVGHINQPWFHALKRRESFAEDFALQWARAFGEL